MRDDDRLLDHPDPEFGTGVVGVCDICGTRQAVIVLSKERYQLCVLDFLNKTWIKSEKKPGSPAPLYRSDRIAFETSAVPSGQAPAIVLSPTKVVRHPAVLIAPDIFGITRTLLDAAIRFAREGFEVLIPDLAKTDGISAGPLVGSRTGARFRGGVATDSKPVTTLVRLYRDGLEALLRREMVDPAKASVFGTAYGASVALALAAESTRLGAVVVAYPMPIRPADLSKLVSAPILCVVGSADRTAARAVAQLRATDPASGLTVAEIAGARSQFLARDLGSYDAGPAEEAWARIIEFLRARMMPPPPRPPPPPAKPVDPLAAKPPAPAASAP
ncbi:MAG TPA: dienelactone hydrolase family protein [Thermoplasmata archaeon]|nr:dienelactone hydrolase family protein [Thermoplasmata archaeon]